MRTGFWCWLIAVALAAPGFAQEQMGARGAVAQAYIKKTNDRHFSFASLRLLTPALYDLVQRGRGELDYDPLCQCHDNDGLSAQILSVAGTSDRSVAHIVLRFDPDLRAPPQRVRLILTRSAAGWKIDDIASAKVPSLKAWLVRRIGSGQTARR